MFIQRSISYLPACIIDYVLFISCCIVPLRMFLPPSLFTFFAFGDYGELFTNCFKCTTNGAPTLWLDCRVCDIVGNFGVTPKLFIVWFMISIMLASLRLVYSYDPLLTLRLALEVWCGGILLIWLALGRIMRRLTSFSFETVDIPIDSREPVVEFCSCLTDIFISFCFAASVLNEKCPS